MRNGGFRTDPETGELLDPHRPVREAIGESLMVLLGEQGRGHEDGDLPAVVHGDEVADQLLWAADYLLAIRVRVRDALTSGHSHESIETRVPYDEFVGQRELKEHLSIVLEAARRRGQSVDHLLFAGPSGLGKTTLAAIVATEMGSHLHVTSGPALERAGDLAAILTKLDEGDVLFVDEIHRLSRAVEEILYPAMEDFQLDIVVGKGPAASSIRLTMPPWTSQWFQTPSSAVQRMGWTMRTPCMCDAWNSGVKPSAKVIQPWTAPTWASRSAKGMSIRLSAGIG